MVAILAKRNSRISNCRRAISYASASPKKGNLENISVEKRVLKKENVPSRDSKVKSSLQMRKMVPEWAPRCQLQVDVKFGSWRLPRGVGELIRAARGQVGKFSSGVRQHKIPMGNQSAC